MLIYNSSNGHRMPKKKYIFIPSRYSSLCDTYYQNYELLGHTVISIWFNKCTYVCGICYRNVKLYPALPSGRVAFISPAWCDVIVSCMAQGIINKMSSPFASAPMAWPPTPNNINKQKNLILIINLHVIYHLKY